MMKLFEDDELNFINNPEKFVEDRWKVVEKEFGDLVDGGSIDSFIGKSFGDCVKGKIFERKVYGHFFRKKFISQFSYSLWDDKSTAIVKERSNKIVSVASGGGFIEWLLQREGIDLIATDETEYGFWDNGFTDIEVIDAACAVRKYSDRDVLMVWANYESEMAFEVAKAMESGRYLFYVGENRGGCVAAEDFFNYGENHFDIELGHNIPTWPGLHDGLYVLKKK